MVKKLKSLANADDKQLASAVRNSAQQIWQAGLGAFAKAQEEGGRVFAKLVKEGNALQQRTRDLAEDKVSEVRETVSGVSKQAAGSWDKLEQVFEDRVSRALGTIGVPTQKDVQELNARVEALTKAVEALTGKKLSPARAATPAAKAAPKAAAKPAAKAVKSAAKPVAKPAAKAAAKPAAKAAKPAAKPAVKAAAKAVAKPAAKAAPKAAPKAKAAAKAAPKAAAIVFPTAESVNAANKAA
jgi:poly(hydroxyalkanoate) granule-associated protein